MASGQGISLSLSHDVVPDEPGIESLRPHLTQTAWDFLCQRPDVAQSCLRSPEVLLRIKYIYDQVEAGLPPPTPEAAVAHAQAQLRLLTSPSGGFLGHPAPQQPPAPPQQPAPPALQHAPSPSPPPPPPPEQQHTQPRPATSQPELTSQRRPSDPPRRPPNSPSDSNSRKRKAPAPPPRTEKRAARWRSTPSAPVRQRIERALTQRLYLIDQEDTSGDDDARRVFHVLGSTGNVYETTICSQPACNCPDFARGNLCKHVLFVMLKVLKVDSQSPLVFQKALLQEELQSIFAEADLKRPSASIIAAPEVRDAFAQAMGQSISDSLSLDSSSSSYTTGRPIDDTTDCPICYDRITQEEVSNGAVTFCRAGCRGNIHSVCFVQWEQQKQRLGQAVTCVLCRQPWGDSGTSTLLTNSDLGVGLEGFLNLATEQSLSSLGRPSLGDSGFGTVDYAW